MFPANLTFLPAAKARLEAQLTLFSTLSQAVLRQSEKLCDSNLTAARSHWEKTTASAKQLLAVQDPQERWTLLSNQTVDNLTTAMSYGREIAGILTASHGEMTKELEAQSAESRRQFATALEQLTPQTLNATDTGAWMTSAMNNMQNGYEQWTSVMRQSVSHLDKQMLAVAEQTSQAAKRSAAAAVRK